MTDNRKIYADDLEKWYMLYLQTINGYHLSEYDLKELTRLNHLVMEASQAIHNNNMLERKQ
jgi:hypothetical protein